MSQGKITSDQASTIALAATLGNIRTMIEPLLDIKSFDGQSELVAVDVIIGTLGERLVDKFDDIITDS